MSASSLPDFITVAAWLWFAGWAIALAVVDLREHRLPNPMVAIAFGGCALTTVVGALVRTDAGLLVGAVGGALVAMAAFAIAHVIGGMGMGDVKYAAVTGWMLGTIGWSAVWWGHVLGFMAAGGVVVVGFLLRRVNRRSALPFGPFMGLGTLVVAATTLT